MTPGRRRGPREKAAPGGSVSTAPWEGRSQADGGEGCGRGPRAPRALRPLGERHSEGHLPSLTCASPQTAPKPGGGACCKWWARSPRGGSCGFADGEHATAGGTSVTRGGGCWGREGQEADGTSLCLPRLLLQVAVSPK